MAYRNWVWILFVFFPVFSIFSNVEKESMSSDPALDLSTGTDQEKLQAIEAILKSKDKSQVPTLIDILNSTQNPRVAGDAAIALGVIGEKEKSTTALKQKIESTENGDIVYACVLALYNIHRKGDKKDPEAEAAIQFALENRRQDPFVADILDRLKDKFIPKS